MIANETQLSTRDLIRQKLTTVSHCMTFNNDKCNFFHFLTNSWSNEHLNMPSSFTQMYTKLSKIILSFFGIELTLLL